MGLKYMSLICFPLFWKYPKVNTSIGEVVMFSSTLIAKPMLFPLLALSDWPLCSSGFPNKKLGIIFAFLQSIFLDTGRILLVMYKS